MKYTSHRFYRLHTDSATGPFDRLEVGATLSRSPRFYVDRRVVTTDELHRLLARNPGDAVRWIGTAAKSGIAAAQIVWGQLLLDGQGVARDARGAFSWFQAAATMGDAEALNMVGRCYEQGWGVPADPGRATECFETAANAGHVWAQVNLAQMLMRAGAPENRPRCFKLFKSAAESGNSKANIKAMNSLARFLEEGWVGQPDLGGAAFWYLKAADAGDHWAQFNLATVLFHQGDIVAANEWFHGSIATSDNGFRRRVAAVLLARHEPALRAHGLDALRRCAESETPNDLYAYACALYDGSAGPRDPSKAAALFKAAAAKGCVEAAERLRQGMTPQQCRVDAAGFILGVARRYYKYHIQLTGRGTL